MVAPTFHRRRQRQHRVLTHTAIALDADQHRPALRQRAGFVEEHRIDRRQTLQGRGIAEEQAQASCAAHPRHDCRRSRQPHRARASHDEHAHRANGGEGESRVSRTEDGPRRERTGGDQENEGHEPLRDTIGRPLQRDPPFLSTGHDPNHQIEDGVVLHVGGLDRDRAETVFAPRQNARSFPAPGAGRFAGQHRFIHGRVAVSDDAVDGNPLPRPHPNEFPRLNLIEWPFLLAAISQHHACGLRDERQELANGQTRPCGRISSTCPSSTRMTIIAALSKNGSIVPG